MTQPERTGLEIAIIGMAGRFPGARDLDALWRNLCDGVDSIAMFDRAALLRAGTDPQLIDRPGFVGAKGVLDDLDRFDAALFGYAPAEAARMDPQIRIFHECVWHALESAGYDPDQTAAPIGLFAGASPHLRWQLLAAIGALGASTDGVADAMAVQQVADRDYLCSLIAYRLGLRGPVYQVQTACSTSLVATHLACQALLGGECKIAVAGGVYATLPQVAGYVHEPGMVLSSDGHTRPFDAASSGTIEGNACGAIVLKLLDDALRDGDPIRAVIRGSATNNDGGDKVGYAAPSVEGQARAVRAAYEVAGVDPASVEFIEAHGTATALGDPIEVEALRLAFAGSTTRCGLGSIKGNIGHTGMAAGVAGVIKAVLCLERGLVPPTANFRSLNPRIAMADAPFYIVDAPTPWARREGAPRRMGVSSFGIGGTNAHLVLEEAPVVATRAAAPATRSHVLPISGRTPAAVQQLAEALAERVEREPLEDIAYTLQVGRKPQPVRAAIACADREAAQRALAAIARGEQALSTVREAPRVVWMFSGQGAHYAGMARDLDAHEPVFRAALDDCFARVRAHAGVDLRAALYPTGTAGAALARQDISQPLIFSLEYALAQLLDHHGVRPHVMIGYSFGEYVAACLAGVFSLDDALRLVALRGRLMQDAPPGAMSSVALSEAELAPLLAPGLSIAVANGPSCIVAGAPEAVAGFEREMRKRGQMPMRLAMAFPGHSEALAPLMAPFAALLERIALAPPQRPYISSATGAPITAAQATSRAYWAQQMRGTVRFAQGIAPLAADPANVLVELGPGRELAALAARFAGDAEDRLFSTIQHGERRVPDTQYFANLLARLWARGVALAWPRAGRRVALPTYPFAETRFPIDDGEHERMLRTAQARSPGLVKHPEPAAWFYAPSWRRSPPPVTSAGVRIALVGASAAPLAEALRALGAEVRALPAELPATLQGERVAYLDALEAEVGDVAAHASRLAAIAQRAPAALAVITRGAAEVTGGEPIAPAQAAIAAVVRVLAQEHPGLACHAIDLDDASGIAALARELVADGEPQRAVRHDQRWTPGYDPIAQRPDAAALARRLRTRGVYVITGGLGGVGLLLARHLARSCQARLVLVSRARAAPDVCAELRALGGEADVLHLDLGDAAATRAALHDVRRRCGALHGVIHAAAIVHGESFRSLGALRPVDWRAQLRAKVEGTEALAAALDGIDVDFVLAFSSISTVLGGLGYGAYAAANAYLEAFAIRMRRAGAPWISVAWDGWNVTGAGEQPNPLGARFAALAMNDDEGAAAFRHALAYDAAHLVHSTSELAVRRAQWVLGASPAPAAPRQARSRPALANERVAPRDELERSIAALWQDLLGYTALGVHDEFLELGGDSLRAITLASRLRAAHGVTLTLEDFFQRMTIAAQADAVRRALGALGAPAAAPPPKPSRTGALLRELAAGSGPPIVLVHPVEGTVFSYYPVARALAKRRVLALESPMLREPAWPHAALPDLGALAARYLDAVTALIDGPWWLGGWSMGGVVALEMLRAARTRGIAEPAGVLLIDPWLPEDSEPAGQGVVLEERARLLAMVGIDDPAGAAYLDAHASGDQLAAFERNRALFAAWRVAPIAARGLLAWAGDQPGLDPIANLARWQALTANGLVSTRLAGDHYGVVSAAGAPALARAIEHVIERRDG